MRQRTFLALRPAASACCWPASRATTPAPTPTASSTSPSRPASATPPSDSATADSPLAGYPTRGVDDDRLSGGIAGVAGVVVMLLLVDRALLGAARAAGTRLPDDARGRSRPDGRRPRPPAPLPRPQPVHRAPAHLKLLALLGFMLVVVATPARLVAVFVAEALVLLAVVALSRVPADLPRAADGDRGAVRGVRAAHAVHRARPPDRGARHHASPSPGCTPASRCWSRAPSACWPR